MSQSLEAEPRPFPDDPEGDSQAWRTPVPVPFDADREYIGLRLAALRLLYLKARDERSLGASDLVNEAVARVFRDPNVREHRDRRYVLAALLKAMKRILIERDRARKRIKRGGHWKRLPLDNVMDRLESQRIGLTELFDHAEELALKSPRTAEVFLLRYLHQMTTAETAQTLGVSIGTVETEITYLRAKLRQDLVGPQ
ncbi:MAG: sigma-70 family RNA polymerase sigma factor [Isosphaeraceae bacterium]